MLYCYTGLYITSLTGFFVFYEADTKCDHDVSAAAETMVHFIKIPQDGSRWQ